MIKVSVFYPKSADSKLDMECCCEKHMPMVEERFGPRCKGVAVDEGLNGGAEGYSRLISRLAICSSIR